jgi:hypothetical protein
MTDADPHLITVGPIQPDGSFVVRTERQGYSYEGAVEGTYELVVMTARGASGAAALPVQYHVPEPLDVQAKSNVLELKVQL